MTFTVPYCGGCKMHCCGQLHSVRPILMPWETAGQFFGLTQQIGKLTLVRQKACGDCIFLHHGQCSIYDKRPFACRMYPFMLDLSKEVTLVLDQHATCAQFVSGLAARELVKLVTHRHFPPDWVRAYNHFAPCLRERRNHGKTSV